MMKKTFILLVLLLALPVSAQTTRTWADSVGTGGNYYNTNTVNQTPGATLTSQSTGVPGTVAGYQPLEPLKSTFNGNTYSSFADYLSTIYKLAVTIGALIAVVMLVTGGVRYMLSESFTDKSSAKNRIVNALWGLTILIGSFLILYTINPTLLTFNLLLPSVNQPSSQFGVANGSNGGAIKPTITTAYLSPSQQTTVASALGCSGYNPLCLKAISSNGTQTADPTYISYYNTSINDTSIQQGIQDFSQKCEGTSFYSSFFNNNTALGGHVHTVDGSLLGAPDQTVMVCSGY